MSDRPAQDNYTEERHPETVEVLKKITAEPQASRFGNTIFHGLNAFLFTNAAGMTTQVRWILKPMQPFDEAGAAPPDKNYLFDELITQIHRQPLRWRLIVIVGKPGDPTNDPSIESVAFPDQQTLDEVKALRRLGDRETEAITRRSYGCGPLVMPDRDWKSPLIRGKEIGGRGLLMSPANSSRSRARAGGCLRRRQPKRRG